MLLSLPQVWWDSATLSGNILSSSSHFQAPKLKAQGKGAEVCTTSTSQVFPSFLLLLLFLELVGAFQWLEQREAEWEMFFFYLFLKGTSHPSPVCVAVLGPSDLFPCTVLQAGVCRIAALGLSFHPSCCPTTDGNQISTWKVTALPETQGEGAALGGKGTPVPEHLCPETFLGVILQDNETLTLWAFWPGTSPTSHFSKNLLLLHWVSESPFGIFREWKSSLFLNFLLKINK